MTAPSPILPAAPESRFINRELSWLEFNARVLHLAEDETEPLLERLKFLAIFADNLDEFFQIRVSCLREQLEAGVVVSKTPDGMSPAEQLAEIRARCTQLIERVDDVYERLLPQLDKAGIRIVGLEGMSEVDLAFVATAFNDRLFPVLTPLSVDPAHPFPYISNLSLNLAAIVSDPVTGSHRFARVKVPPLLPRFLELPDGERFVPIEDVIAAHLDTLFPGMQILSRHAFRVTRDADVEVEEDEAEDLLQAIESVLWRRRRAASPVRLEVDAGMSSEVLDLLIRELDLEPSDVYV